MAEGAGGANRRAAGVGKKRGNLRPHVGSGRGAAGTSAGGTGAAMETEDEVSSRRPQRHSPQRVHAFVSAWIGETGVWSIDDRTLPSMSPACSPPIVQGWPFLVLPGAQRGITASAVSQSDLHQIAEKLSHSQILRDYERAFSEATGLPLAFQRTDSLQPALRASAFANPFCVGLSASHEGCRLCHEVQQKLTAPGTTDSRTEKCPAGLTDSAVPVRLGQQTIGFLQTGQVALRKLNHTTFKALVKWLDAGGAHADWHALEKSYLESPQLGPVQYDAMVRLLEVFAQHLSLAAERIATQQDLSEPPLVTRARQFIEEHQGEDITLDDVAKAVHASTFHFCKMFKKATGMTFTHYLSLSRVAKAKALLANPQLRISEIAYEVGFNSLTHFNRMFRKLTGESPTAYREALAAA